MRAQKQSPSQISRSPKARLLNVGCGNWYHPDWINLDLSHVDAQVIQHDIVKGLPFASDHFDAVYHSHVLEHLTPDEGGALIRECFRVLKPGGVLRVVVPDLEQIARLYLQQHELACQGDELAKANYDWMKLELIDQMVRQYSGGSMGEFITSPLISNPDFVLSRLGNEYNVCLDASRPKPSEQFAKNLQENVAPQSGFSLSRVSQKLCKLRQKIVLKLVGLLLGKKMRQACEEGIFRSQGEIHRWMYDRHSLNQLCIRSGFVNCGAGSAFESQIERFNEYQLDIMDGRVRKPDSLFFECLKPISLVQFGEESKSPLTALKRSGISAA